MRIILELHINWGKPRGSKVASNSETFFLSHLWILFGCFLMELCAFLFTNSFPLYSAIHIPGDSLFSNIIFGALYFYFGGGGTLFVFQSLFGMVQGFLDPPISNEVDVDE